MDRAGRIVVPKALRRQLQLDDGGRVEMRERDGLIELRPAAAEVEIISTPEGPVARRISGTDPDADPQLTDDLIRTTLERTRR